MCSMSLANGTAVAWPNPGANIPKVIVLDKDANATVRLTNLAVGSTCYFYMRSADNSC